MAMVLICVVVAIVLDYAVGSFKALYYLRIGDEAHKEEWWTSRKMWDGIVHKFTEILLLLVAWGIDYAAPLFSLNLPFAFEPFVGCFLVIMEIGSVLENIRELNPALSKPIKTIQETIKPNSGEHDE